MPSLPTCPNPLPSDIDGELQRLAQLWAKHPLRPRIENEVAEYWERLIALWVADASLPLLIRKTEKGIARGEVVRHKSGRDLVPTDNSPASWSYMAAFTGQRPSVEDIQMALSADTIPVTMVLDRESKARAKFKCCRTSSASPNEKRWKVCHKRPVGLHGRASIIDRPITELHAHFRDFLSPSNIFLVPLLLGGLGEIPHFIEAVSNEPHGL